eukprot:CAMPEP_0185559250 /NCGR_PEP_ID=MMETSP1381-20130426/54113_1 /TAXON_ID=298111 /ORGANISM="Pavlova sp., Strain CCMP459" /LENGTH=49 /DNA_ID=CAMNT_0028172855 /DNA_START=55 /DNA_END=204 /DNA_ORIENTATION=-
MQLACSPQAQRQRDAARGHFALPRCRARPYRVVRVCHRGPVRTERAAGA